MKQRILSGAILVLFFAAIVLFNQSFPLALNIVVALISVTAVFELVKALGLGRKWFLAAPALLAAALVPFCKDNVQFLVYCLFTLLLFSAMIVYHQETTFKEVGVLYSMVVLIPSALQTLVSLRDLSDNHGMFYVLIAVLSAWVADAGAYFAGTFFGKHKLCPNISPKKTIEGAIGGVIGAALLGFLYGAYFEGRMEAMIRPGVISAAACAIAAVISQLGDLAASAIKRNHNVKDYGNLIPGHGGVLDRFDSMIFTAPAIYFAVLFLGLR